MIYFVGKSGKRYGGIKRCSLEYVLNYCRTKSVLGLDIETTKNAPKDYRGEVYSPGLDPYLSKVVMLQIGDQENQFVIDCRYVDITPLIQWMHKNPDVLFVGHNLKFEAKMLKYHYGLVMLRIHDVMICEQILFNGIKQSYSLLEISKRRLGKQSVTEVDLFNWFDEDGDYIDKGTRLEFLTIGNKDFTAEQIQYGAEDIVNPLLIREMQLQGRYIDGTWWKPLDLFDLENEYVLVLADKELNGMSFDPELWKETAALKQVEYDHRIKVLNDYVIKNFAGTKFVQSPDLFNAEYKCNILWSSSDQVIKFFLHLGFCPKEKSKQTKRMEYSVSSKALMKLLPKDYTEKLRNSEFPESINSREDLILAFLLYNESHQAVTTFGLPWLKYIHPITGRVHTNYKQIKNTGRLSSYKPNLQNIPSDDLYRRCFVHQEGWKLINCDFAAQELRVLAEVTKEPKMLDFFNNGHPIFGDDMHCMVATEIYRIVRDDPKLIINKKDHPAERNNAKSVSFLTIYGGSAFALMGTIGTTEEVAQSIIDAFFMAFPSLGSDFELTKKTVVSKGFIVIDNIVNRMYFDPDYEEMVELGKKAWSFFPEDYRSMGQVEKELVKKRINEEHPELKEIWSKYFALRGSLERKGLNYRIQGFAGSQTKMAGIMIRRAILDLGLEDKLMHTNSVHDETLVEVREDYAEEGRALVEQCMIDGGNYFCKLVKMGADAVITPYWKH